MPLLYNLCQYRNFGTCQSVQIQRTQTFTFLSHYIDCQPIKASKGRFWAKKSNLFQAILQDDQLPGRDHLHEVSAVEGGFENVDRNFAEAFRIELVEQLPPLVLHRHRAEQLFVVVIVELFGAVVILLRNRL